MRHKAKTDRLGRFSSLRKATIRSIVTAILLHQSIITTKAKAKASRGLIEKLITLGKKGDLACRRRAFSILCDHNLVKLLFEVIAPKFTQRNGGYTRLITYKNQRGDNAQLAILELTERYELRKPQKEIKEKVEKVQKEAIKKEQEEPKKEEPQKEEPKKEEPKKEKPIKEVKAEPKEKAPEEKKPGGLFKGFKGFFKKDK
jgi:large subunit ribosomal protein L17